jgi:hypothetical protein
VKARADAGILFSCLHNSLLQEKKTTTTKKRRTRAFYITLFYEGILCNHSLVYPRINSQFCLFLKHLRIPFMEHQSLRI